MPRAKLITGLVFLVGAFAALTTTASAWWVTNNGTPQGKVTAGPGEFTAQAGFIKIACPSASGEWHIKKAVEHKPFENQELVNEGGHLGFLILVWGNAGNNTCPGHIGSTAVTVLILKCEIQLEQQEKGETKATGSVITECGFSAIGCTVGVPIANVSTGKNYKLETTALSNEGSNQNDEVNVVKISTAPVKSLACELGGIKATEDGTLKIPKVVVEGAKLA